MTTFKPGDRVKSIHLSGLGTVKDVDGGEVFVTWDRRPEEGGGTSHSKHSPAELRVVLRTMPYRSDSQTFGVNTSCTVKRYDD